MNIDNHPPQHDEGIEVHDLDFPRQRKRRYQRYLDFFLRRRRWLITAFIALAALSLVALLTPLALSALLHPPAQDTNITANTTSTSWQIPHLLGSTQDIVCVSGKTAGTIYGLHSNNGTLAWRYQATHNFLAAPIPTQNALYLLEQQGSAMHVHALRMRNGASLWQTTLSTASPSSLSIAGSILYVTAQNGTLAAFDTNNGRRLWSEEFPPNPSVRILNGIVYVYVNDDQSLRALQAEHGTILWQKYEKYFLNILTPNSGVILLQTQDGPVEALRTSDGHTLWSRTFYADANTPIVTTSTTAYLNTDAGQVAAINVQDGKVLWRTQQTHPLLGTMVLSHDTLYLASIDNNLYAFHVQNGSLFWQKNMRQVIDGTMTIIRDRLYLHTNDGLEHVIQTSNGSAVWTQFIGQPAHYQHISEPNTYAQYVLTSAQMVYITEEDGTLNALQYDTGVLQWVHQITGLPQLFNNTLYIIPAYGSITAIDAEDSHYLWSSIP